jgi:hypothetical protein
MPQMICTGLARYAGKDLKKGQKFDVEDAHVRTLEVTRKAKLAPAAKAEDKAAGAEQKDGTYATREMTAGNDREMNKADAKK